MAKGILSAAINQAAWFNRPGADGSPLTPADIIATNLTPLASDANNKRNSEGLLKKEQVWQNPNLYIAYNSGRDFTATIIGKVAQQKWSKGPGDQAGEWGGFDFYDVQDGNDWKVYIDTPVHVEGQSTYYYPVNGGKFEYGASKFATDPIAIQAKLLAKQQAQAAIDMANQPAGSGSSGANPYVYTPAGSMPAQAMSRMGVELTLPQGPNGPIWWAKTRDQSAAQSGPHPGIAVAGPMVWNPEWGKPEDNGLPPGKAILTIDGKDLATVRPAGRVLKIVMGRAASGDSEAMEVLDELEIDPPSLNARGWLDRIF